MIRPFCLAARRSACALVLGIVGCASSADPTEPQSDSTTDELSMRVPSFVAVRADLRRCAAPLCGGYFVRDVNRGGGEVAVARWLHVVPFHSQVSL